MWDGYADVPVTSRAAEAELERQRARRVRRANGLAVDGEAGGTDVSALGRDEAPPGRQARGVPASGG